MRGADDAVYLPSLAVLL